MHHAKNAFHQRERHHQPHGYSILYLYIFVMPFAVYFYFYFIIIWFSFIFFSSLMYNIPVCSECVCVNVLARNCWPRLTAQIFFNCIELYAQRVLDTTWPVWASKSAFWPSGKMTFTVSIFISLCALHSNVFSKIQARNDHKTLAWFFSIVICIYGQMQLQSHAFYLKTGSFPCRKIQVCLVWIWTNK